MYKPLCDVTLNTGSLLTARHVARSRVAVVLLVQAVEHLLDVLVVLLEIVRANSELGLQLDLSADD